MRSNLIANNNNITLIDNHFKKEPIVFQRIFVLRLNWAQAKTVLDHCSELIWSLFTWTVTWARSTFGCLNCKWMSWIFPTWRWTAWATFFTRPTGLRVQTIGSLISHIIDAMFRRIRIIDILSRWNHLLSLGFHTVDILSWRNRMLELSISKSVLEIIYIAILVI